MHGLFLGCHGARHQNTVDAVIDKYFRFRNFGGANAECAFFELPPGQGCALVCFGMGPQILAGRIYAGLRW